MPVVLLHPVGLDGRCWDRVPLDGAIAYDLLGHGGRPRPEPPTMAVMADDVVSRVEGPLDVIGLSLGGAVALQIALRHPERVRSLVVACSAAFSVHDLAIERAESAERGGDGSCSAVDARAMVHLRRPRRSRPPGCPLCT